MNRKFKVKILIGCIIAAISIVAFLSIRTPDPSTSSQSTNFVAGQVNSSEQEEKLKRYIDKANKRLEHLRAQGKVEIEPQVKAKSFNKDEIAFIEKAITEKNKKFVNMEIPEISNTLSGKKYLLSKVTKWAPDKVHFKFSTYNEENRLVSGESSIYFSELSAFLQDHFGYDKNLEAKYKENYEYWHDVIIDY